MPTIRSTVFGNGEYYHVFNRGIERKDIFHRDQDYRHYLDTLSYYQYEDPPVKFSRYLEFSLHDRTEFFEKLKKHPRLVRIHCYALMPNHFHFIISQIQDKGITQFMSQSTNSYAKHFNTRYEHEGKVFQGYFKASWIESTEQLIHLSRYIHLNPCTSYMVAADRLLTYRWTSLSNYLTSPVTEFVDANVVMSSFTDPQAYFQFVQDQVSYARELKKIEHLLLRD